MIFSFLFIQLTQCCLRKINDITVYPTTNEVYQLPMEILFKHSLSLKYECIGCNNKDVRINNTIELIQHSDLNETFKTISYNGTHFACLQTESTKLLIYDKFQQLVLSIPLNKSWQCNNAEFTVIGNIVMDCYLQNVLQFQFVQNGTLNYGQNYLYTKNTQLTQIIMFIENKQEYYLYLQSYQGFSVLTLLEYGENSLKNITAVVIQNASLVQVGYSENKIIYLTNQYNLFQFQIQNNLFILINTTPFPNPILQLKVKNFNQVNSQFDTIVLCFQDDYYPVQVFKAIPQSVQFIYGNLLELNQIFNTTFTIQIDINFEFLLVKYGPYYYLSHHWLIFENPIQQNYYQTKYDFEIFDNFEDSMIFLTKENLLYSFGNRSRIFLIQQPRLVIKSSEIQKSKILIQGLSRQIKQFCGVVINYQVLKQFDEGTYEEKANYLPNPVLTFDYQWQIYLENFSGSLLQIYNHSILNSNTECQLSDSTMTLMADMNGFINNNNTYITNIVTFKFNNMKFYFLVIASGLNLSFFVSVNEVNFTNVQNYTLQVSASDIQISLNYPSNITVGIDQGNSTVFLILLNFLTPFEINASSQVRDVQNTTINSFVLSYQSLIILTSDHSLIIYSLSNSIESESYSAKLIEEIFLNKYGEAIQFNPENIKLNYLFQSSLLFINNQQNVLIFEINKNNHLDPIQIISQTQGKIIQQINILQNLLVLLFRDAKDNFIEVWDIENILIPNFNKQIQVLDFDSSWQIYSDELFLYIKSITNKLRIYQLRLPQHKSLFYQFNFQSQRIRSTYSLSNNNIALVSIGIQIFNLKTGINYQVSCQPQNFTFISQLYFKYWVESSLSSLNYQEQFQQLQIRQQSQISQIQIISFFKTTTNITIQEDVKLPINRNRIQIPIDQLNIQEFNSILNISSTSDSKCQVQNYFSLSNNYSQLSQFQKLFNIVFNVDSNFFFQNNQIIFNQSETRVFVNFSKYQFNFTRCLTTTVYETIVSTICQSNTSEYYLLGYNYSDDYFALLGSAKVNISQDQQPRAIFQYKLLLFITQSFIVGHHYIIPFYLNYTYVNTIYSSCQAIDFTVANLYGTEQNETILVFGICPKLINYQLAYYSSSPLQVVFIEGESNILFLEQYLQCDFDFQAIEVLEVSYSNILILLITKYTGSYQVYLIYDKQQHIIRIQSLVKIIPPYGNYLATANIFSQNNTILQVFLNESNNSTVFAFYNLSNLKQLNQPLTMLGGFEIPFYPISIAFNLNNDSTGQLEYIQWSTNNYEIKLFQQNFTLAYIKCKLHKILILSSRNTTVTFSASNSFGSQNFSVTFYDDTDSLKYQEYFLLSILLVIIILLGLQMKKCCSKNEIQDENFMELEL